MINLVFIYLLGALRCFQHCTGHITTGSWKGRGNQYIQFVRVLYCKLLTNGKQLPAFPLGIRPGFELRSQRWDMTVLPLFHRGPIIHISITGCAGNRTLASEVGGESVTTLPPWPPFATVITKLPLISMFRN